MASSPRSPQPTGYQKFLVGQFREAGWTIGGSVSKTHAYCECALRHKAHVREDIKSDVYVQDLLHWLRFETCFGS